MAIQQGEHFTLEISGQTQERISAELAREKLTPEQVASITSEVKMEVMRSNRYNGDKRKFVMPNLANLTLGGLIDLLGAVREEVKDGQKLEGIYKEAIKARIKEKEAEEALLAQKKSAN